MIIHIDEYITELVNKQVNNNNDDSFPLKDVYCIVTGIIINISI